MDRKKFFIFLILFDFIIISLFSNFNKVSAATTLDWKDLPSGCPTPTDVYNALPDDQKSLVSVDKYAFYSLTYTRDNKNWKTYCYIFTPATSHFADKGGWFTSDDYYVRVIFHDFDTSLSSEPANWEFGSVSLRGYNDSYCSLENHKVDYYFTTFNIYGDSSYSDDNILFLHQNPSNLGTILLMNKDKVLKQVVLLLPVVLVTLVLLIGLRKALTMLFHFLRKS